MLTAANRGALEEMTGRRKAVTAPVPVPAPTLSPAPVAARPIVPAPSFMPPKQELSAEVVAGLTEASRQMTAAAQKMASAAQAPQPMPQVIQLPPADKPQQLEAAVQRDKSGKLEKITIRAQDRLPHIEALVQRGADGKLDKLIITVGQA